MDEPVAKTELLAVHPDGTRATVTIEIGKPYLHQSGEGFEEWACPVSLTPLYKNLRDARGGDPFQALCLASALILDLLSGFKEKGGTLLFEEGQEFPLEAYSFDKR
ncbi:MAG: hypothetical protein IDH49_14905 [Gammaproteobacteria bacterium]|nr:hypothetical protein [Gammaproteobacteria bacterium]